MVWPPIQWLVARGDFNELATLKGLTLPLQAPAVLSFRDPWMPQALDKMQQSMIPGDELWTFSSPPETWQHLMGRAGIALVRNGKPIAHIVTMMN